MSLWACLLLSTCSTFITLEKVLWCPTRIFWPHQFSSQLPCCQRIVPPPPPPTLRASLNCWCLLCKHTHSSGVSGETAPKRALTDDAGSWCISPPCPCPLGKVALRHSPPCFLASLRRITLQMPAMTCCNSLFGILSFPSFPLPYSPEVFWDHQDNYLHWHSPQSLLLGGTDIPSRAGIPFSWWHQLFPSLLGTHPLKKGCTNCLSVSSLYIRV